MSPKRKKVLADLAFNEKALRQALAEICLAMSHVATGGRMEKARRLIEDPLSLEKAHRQK